MLVTTALLVFPHATLAQTSVFGTWCPTNGGAFEISAEGFADFEHTVCTFDKVQSPGSALSTSMTCRIFRYTDDAKAIETRRDRTEFDARLIEDDLVEVNYNDGRGGFKVPRCKENGKG